MSVAAQIIELPAQPDEQLQSQALTLAEQARALRVIDQQSFDLAADKLRGVVALRKEIQGHYKPLKDAANEAHKRICDAERSMLAPVQEAESVLKQSVASYETTIRRQREEAERKAREEAERARLEEIEREIEAAEASGASPEEVQTIIETPVVIPTPRVVAPAVQHTPARGVTTVQTFSAEVVNIMALCRAIADGAVSANLVAPNMSALNQMARAMKNTFNIPGCRVVATAVVRASGGR